MNSRDCAPAIDQDPRARLPDSRSRQKRSRAAEHDEALAESIWEGIEDLGHEPKPVSCFLAELSDTHPSRSEWIFETACAWSPELAASFCNGDGSDPRVLVAEIQAAFASDRDAASTGLMPGRSRLVETTDPAHRPIAEMIARLCVNLGLDPSAVVVDLSPEAAAVARRTGSVAVALDGRIHLDRNRFDAYSPAGREVLAHDGSCTSTQG